jgi:hypothetical protein
MATRRSEDRLLPTGAIVAMVVAASLIVGLAYWVGDSIAPDFAALLPVATREAAPAPPPPMPVRMRLPDEETAH